MEHTRTRIVIQPLFGFLERISGDLPAADCAADHGERLERREIGINPQAEVAKSFYCFKIGTREGNLAKNEIRARADADRDEETERVPELEPQASEPRDHQVLFPMAVGALFLVMLVVGALLG